MGLRKDEERGAGKGGRKQGAPSVTFPRAGGDRERLPGGPRQEAWGGLGGIHESPSLTNTVLQADKTNASAYRLSYSLPVQMLRHQALASILPDI